MLAVFDENGFPVAFYDPAIHGDGIPDVAIEISREQWVDLLSNPGQRKWVDGEIVKVDQDLPSPPENVAVLYPTDLWRRMTDAEVSAVEAVMVTQSSRIQRIFNAATEYRSDDELWPLLMQIAQGLFGEARAAEILAPSI
ncbi:MAG: hypothetical protein JSR13_06070 [Proteobacteria bacterium]|nr:hypothetical protein [Pseudomonadota bacterium]